MRSFSRLLQSSPFLVWLAVAAVPACSGASPEGMDAVRDSNETFVTERGARGSSAANGSLGKNETVAYIDVERVTIAAPDEPLEGTLSVQGIAAVGAGSLNPATPVGSPVAVNPDTVVAASPADARAQEPASAANAQALARFAKVSGAPGQQLDRQLLEMAGLVRSIPEIGQCERSATGDHRAAVGSHGAAGDFELLDAGTVRLFPGDEAAVTLAPRAFPGVSSFNSGVVYTSRDRSTSLPSGLDYRVEVSGGSRVAPMTIRGIAPRQLEHVTLNGSPLQHVEAVSNLGPQDLTWDVGAAGDTVYLDLTANDVAESVRCAYADESGAGTVPAALLASLHGAGHLTVHRLRRLHTVPEPISHAVGAGILPQRAELRFDFEVSRVVRFAEVAAGRTTATVAPLEAVRANEAARPADAVPGMEIQRTAELMRPAGSLRRVAAVAETPVSEAE